VIGGNNLLPSPLKSEGPVDACLFKEGMCLSMTRGGTKKSLSPVVYGKRLMSSSKGFVSLTPAKEKGGYQLIVKYPPKVHWFI